MDQNLYLNINRFAARSASAHPLATAYAIIDDGVHGDRRATMRRKGIPMRNGAMDAALLRAALRRALEVDGRYHELMNRSAPSAS